MKKEDVEKLLHEKVEAGLHISPILPEGIKNYLIDIDGTITEDVPNEEPERMGTCKPFPDALKTLNNWVGDKLINLANTMFAHSSSELNRVYDNNHNYIHMSVGGILGGHISKLKWFINEFDKVSDICLESNYILNHEAIITKINLNIKLVLLC